MGSHAIAGVRSAEQRQRPCPSDCFTTAVHAQFAIKVTDVGLYCVYRHTQLCGDFRGA
jgi:hypothetical protein